MKKYEIHLTEIQLVLVREHLERGEWRVVNPVLVDIYQQIAAQSQPQTTEPYQGDKPEV